MNGDALFGAGLAAVALIGVWLSNLRCRQIRKAYEDKRAAAVVPPVQIPVEINCAGCSATALRSFLKPYNPGCSSDCERGCNGTRHEYCSRECYWSDTKSFLPPASALGISNDVFTSTDQVATRQTVNVPTFPGRARGSSSPKGRSC